MLPFLVVVADESGEHRPDEVVQAFAAEGPNDTFSNRVRTGRMHGCGDGIDTEAPRAVAEVAPIDGVPIAEQMPRLAPPGRRLDHLAPDPGGGRAGGHVDMHQLTPAVGDEHQHIQGLEGEGRDREQVGGPQVVGMVGRSARSGWVSGLVHATGSVESSDC